MSSTTSRELGDPRSTSHNIDDDNASQSPLSQNILTDGALPVLILISHGHSPPLNPTPDLKFDVRSLPNPPKHIRDAHNGTSKRLQEWLLRDSDFIAQRDMIMAKILAALQEAERGRALKKREGLLESDADAFPLREECPRFYADLDRVEEREKGGPLEANPESSGSSSHTDNIEITVGVNCAMGRHRSVAMAEILAGEDWRGWEVRVEHRDILKKREHKKNAGGRKSRGVRGGDGGYYEDDSC
ncbi:hypothetical protein BGZ60DRAFT_172691 [Tricladium varicosporioides]|nr:hypothetical protein BGZ60DRAFT_172691 [Hymenoscyphus varicosporioides]